MPKKIKSIITGGAGFIGSHLAEKLVSDGHKVIIIDNLKNGNLRNLKEIKNKITFVKADISINNNWANHFKNANNVFHLAALADIVPSISKPKEYFDTNVTGTFNVLEACKSNSNARLIYCASSTCYGIPKTYPTPESYSISTKYPYALTKYLGEQLVMHWSSVYKVKSISLRLFNVYGERSRTTGTYGAVFGVFLAQKLAKKPFTVVGTGKQKRDFTYVKDVVEAMVLASKSNKYGEIYNVGSGKAISINKIVSLLVGDKVYLPKRPGEPDITFADIKKIKAHLKWKPKTTIEKGINILLNNMSHWKSAPVWTVKKINKATKVWFQFLK